MVAAAFSAAPVTNPDGTTGITLIQNYGQGGPFTGGNLINDADGIISGDLDTEFLKHKTANFAANRNGRGGGSRIAQRFGSRSGERVRRLQAHAWPHSAAARECNPGGSFGIARRNSVGACANSHPRGRTSLVREAFQCNGLRYRFAPAPQWPLQYLRPSARR